MAIISIDIDLDQFEMAQELTGMSSNRATVALALRTLIAVRRQPATVERIIGRRSALASREIATRGSMCTKHTLALE